MVVRPMDFYIWNHVVLVVVIFSKKVILIVNRLPGTAAWAVRLVGLPFSRELRLDLLSQLSVVYGLTILREPCRPNENLIIFLTIIIYFIFILGGLIKFLDNFSIFQNLI